MPLTPYHFGPTLLAGVVLFPFIDLVAILIGSVILDIEPVLVLFLHLGGPLHGVSHTYLVATIVSVILAGVIWFLRNPMKSIMSAFGVIAEPRKSSILAGSFLGTYSHIFLDGFLYAEMNPFYPVLGNPFLGLISLGIVQQLCLYSGLIGIVLYFVRFCIMRKGAD
ncbi:MAG: hypothetical protein ACFFD3_08690, partial [Candidatus Thorarchaeota archaeon]